MCGKRDSVRKHRYRGRLGLRGPGRFDRAVTRHKHDQNNTIVREVESQERPSSAHRIRNKQHTLLREECSMSEGRA